MVKDKLNQLAAKLAQVEHKLKRSGPDSERLIIV